MPRPQRPGDLLFHLRAEREDMTFELERQLLDVVGDAAAVADETTGFRYFDARDLLGFVDGTANPTGAELPDAALITADADPAFAGGSYVVVQRYVHDMAAWATLSTEDQEAIMGRTKIDNIELDDDEAPRKSRESLATIEDGAGGELAILRDNMPFGRPGAGEFGTYFIGYSGRLWVIEQMLERMLRRGAARRLRPAAGLLDRDHRYRRSSSPRPACSRTWPSRPRAPPPRRRTFPSSRRRRRPPRWASAPCAIATRRAACRSGRPGSPFRR